MGALVGIALQQLPAIIEAFKGLHQQANPGAPPLTDAEVIEIYQQALASSLARDAQWLSQHSVTDVSGNVIHDDN